MSVGMYPTNKYKFLEVGCSIEEREEDIGIEVEGDRVFGQRQRSD